MEFPKDKIKGRYTFIKWVFVALGLAILCKALYTMTVKSAYWEEVAKQRERVNLELKPRRGNLLASNGEVLAASIPEYLMYMDFGTWEKDSARAAKDLKNRDSLFLKDLDSICIGMADIFPDMDTANIRAHLLKGQQRRSHSWPLYTAAVLKPEAAKKRKNKKRNQRVTYVQYKDMKSLPFLCKPTGISGFYVDTIPVRKNPYGALARRTVGRFDSCARYGLELSCDSFLAGKSGSYHTQKLMKHLVRVVDVPAEDGYDVMTTIDVDIQDICERVLREQLEYLVETSNGQTQEGVVIVLETATGDIKAMTSLSRNPDNSFSENQPLAVGNMYEPGSVFKPMSFLVAMDDGKMDLNSSVDVGNGVRTMYRRFMRDHNWRRGTGYGLITTPEIIKYSSNIGVSVIIDEAYKDDPAQFVDGLYRLGVAEDLKIPLDHYHKPYIRRPTKANWSKTALPWMSIGYETQVPPISTVNFYAGVANNGKMFRPRLIKALLRDGQIVKEFPNEVLREQMARPEAIKMIQHCLYEVVHTGLGRRAGSKMFDVSGKTGTAQIWTRAGKSQEYLISFAGYFPSQKPRYACIVCIRKSGTASGGGMCGPVFSKIAESIMAKAHQSDFSGACDTVNTHLPQVKAGDIEAGRQVLKQFGITHQAHFNEYAAEAVWGAPDSVVHIISLSPADEHQDSIPDVTGYGLRDALYRLESAGLHVQTKGVGVVVKQSKKAGTTLHPGDTITLTLSSKPKTKKSKQ